jgi:hypothetical protein
LPGMPTDLSFFLGIAKGAFTGLGLAPVAMGISATQSVVGSTVPGQAMGIVGLGETAVSSVSPGASNFIENTQPNLVVKTVKNAVRETPQTLPIAKRPNSTVKFGPVNLASQSVKLQPPNPISNLEKIALITALLTFLGVVYG